MKMLVLGAAAPSDLDDTTSLWLVENDGVLLIERFARVCDELGAQMICAVRAVDLKRHRIDSVIQLAAPYAQIVRVLGDTQGAACTALLCIRQIAAEEGLLILNINEYLDIDYRYAIDSFLSRGLDAGVIVFPSIHPRYAHVRVEDGLIVEAAEKHPISRHASAGAMWYRRGGDFIAAAQAMIRKDAQVDGRFFVSLTLNEMILRQQRCGMYEIEAGQYHPLKSAKQRVQFEQEALAG